MTLKLELIPEEKVADSLFNKGVESQKKSAHKEAIEIFEKSFKIYKEIGKHKESGDCLIKIGNSYYFQSDFNNAILYYNNAIKIYKQIRYKEGVASGTNNIGAIYYHLGYLLKALENYKFALDIQEEIGNKRIAEATTHNIGGIYFDIRDYQKAKEYFDKAYDIAKELGDSLEVAKILNNIGKIFIQQKSFEEALVKLTLSKRIAEELGSKNLQLAAISSLGDLFYSKGNLARSIEYNFETLKLSINIKDRQSESNSLISIGTIFLDQGRYEDAIKKCKSGLAIANDIGSLSLIKNAYECLYKGNKYLGNDKQALFYVEKANTFRDSLRTKETSNKMLGMEFQNQQLLDSIAYVKKEHGIKLRHTEEIKRKEYQRNMGIISLVFILIVAAGLWSRLNFVRKSKRIIQVEKDRSEKLLLNILPGEIATELKEKGEVNTKDFPLASILFSDFKSFTQISEKMTSHELVEEINICFKAFDFIVQKYGIEKIKTIGDSYMAAGGIPVPNKNALNHIVLAGLEMQEFMQRRLHENQSDEKPAFEMRVGIHAGPLVAGVVGVKKFQYDVWGDTVNTASRMESNGSVGKVNISETLYQFLKDIDLFSFEYRGNIRVKGKGNMNMYFVERKERELSPATTSLVRNNLNS